MAHNRKGGLSLTALYERQQGKCAYCKQLMSLIPGLSSSATRDHVVPKTQGGGQQRNLVAACRQCNEEKGDLTADQYREQLRNRETRGQAPTGALS